MTFNSGKEIDDTVSSVTEFGVGATLRLILLIVIIGAVVLMAIGDTESSAEAVAILLTFVGGGIIGAIVLSIASKF